MGIIGRNERKRAKIGAEIVGSCWGRCRSVPLPNAVRALHKQWQATGYDWERLLVVEMCRVGVGESAFGNFGRFRCRGLLGAKAQLFCRFWSHFRWERRGSVADVI